MEEDGGHQPSPDLGGHSGTRQRTEAYRLDQGEEVGVGSANGPVRNHRGHAATDRGTGQGKPTWHPGSPIFGPS
eukprot:1895215-Alexandrium_andersonii.AAC.1